MIRIHSISLHLLLKEFRYFTQYIFTRRLACFGRNFCRKDERFKLTINLTFDHDAATQFNRTHTGYGHETDQSGKIWVFDFSNQSFLPALFEQ